MIEYPLDAHFRLFPLPVQRYAPSDPTARTLFEALEQARYRALGASRFKGVAANLEASLDARCRELGFDQASERNPAQLAEVLALRARSALTGRDAPESAEPLLALWRDQMPAELDDLLDRLHDQQQDQMPRI